MNTAIFFISTLLLYLPADPLHTASPKPVQRDQMEVELLGFSKKHGFVKSYLGNLGDYPLKG